MITKTNQELFDIALNGIKAHGLSYVTNDFTGRMTCMYRQNLKADCPVRCGIGHMIPDELYDVDMEHLGIWDRDGFGIFPKHQLDFLDGVQTAHDHAVANNPQVKPEVAFIQNMRQVAKKYHLHMD